MSNVEPFVDPGERIRESRIGMEFAAPKSTCLRKMSEGHNAWSYVLKDGALKLA